MNNTSLVIDIVNKIPSNVYFQQMPDRQQTLIYIEYLFQNVPASKQVDSDKLFREVISRQLRIVSMKIIEPEILLLIALDKITIADFKLSSDELVKKVIGQNSDKYDLDVMQRIVAQIMTKLPRDLRERVAGKHKLQVFQLIAKQIHMEPKLLEKFINYDPNMNSAISMELNNSDYDTLNKKYLQELYSFQNKNAYIDSNSLEYGAIAAKMSLSQSSVPATTNSNLLTAQYIDKNPALMLGTKDKIIYYFDPSSGTISELPMNGNQVPVSVNDLKTILVSQNIKKNDIDNTIAAINAPTSTPAPAPTQTTASDSGSFFNLNKLENLFHFSDNPAITTQTTIPSMGNPTIGNPTMAPDTPIPPEFLKELIQLKYNNGNPNMDTSVMDTPTTDNINNIMRTRKPVKQIISKSEGNEMKRRFQKLYNTYEHNPVPTITSKSSFQNIATPEITVINKIKNDNKNIEKMATGFITILILIFLIVIILYIKGAKSSSS